MWKFGRTWFHNHHEEFESCIEQHLGQVQTWLDQEKFDKARNDYKMGDDSMVEALRKPERLISWIALHGELAEKVMQLYTITAAALQDESFDFHPLLPDDDTDIADRVEALADWCKGFLAGFAYASVGGNRASSALSEDSSEILKDFAAIAQAGLEEREDEEESESSFMELVEYLRFATLNLFMDNLEQAGEKAADSAPIH